MSTEFLALQQQATWSLVPPPPSHNVLGCRWTYKTKLHSDGTITRHKDRLVSQRFTQEYGIDYQDTFSPVAKMQTIRMLLAVATSKSWPIRQFDISNAFLHGKLEDEVYMQQPPGYVDAQFPTHVCLLHKALYSLKQAPRMWFSTFASHLKNISFQSSTADSILFINRLNTPPIFLLIYVDDILFTGGTSSNLAETIHNLQTKFRMKDLGQLSTFLGIQTVRTSDGYFLHQTTYLQEILKLAGFQHSKSVTTPTSSKLAPPPASDTSFNQPTLYRRIIGSLQYLTLTRSEIQFAVNSACQSMHHPTEEHFHHLKRILCYLHETPQLGLPVRPAPLTRTAYSDSDWAGD